MSRELSTLRRPAQKKQVLHLGGEVFHFLATGLSGSILLAILRNHGPCKTCSNRFKSLGITGITGITTNPHSPRVFLRLGWCLADLQSWCCQFHSSLKTRSGKRKDVISFFFLRLVTRANVKLHSNYMGCGHPTIRSGISQLVAIWSPMKRPLWENRPCFGHGRYMFSYTAHIIDWIYISPHFLLCHNCCCLDLPISPDDVVMVAAILTFQCLWVPRPRAPEKLHSHLRGATLQIRQAINLSTHFRKIMENPWFHQQKNRTLTSKT